MIKCELINRTISIPHCIWCNFTFEKDYCRWIVYDNEQPDGDKHKIYSDAFGFKELAYFNYFRDSSLDNIEFIKQDLGDQTIKEIEKEFKQQNFIDYTDQEKDQIRLTYANHLPNHSLMLYKECSETENKAILSRLVFLTPHPKDKNGLPIPMIKDSDGNTKEWTRCER